MSHAASETDPLSIAARFDLSDEPRAAKQFGSGHINRTYAVETDGAGRYLLQQINTHVFSDPGALMANMRRVTEHLAGKVRQRGLDPERHALQIVRAADGRDLAESESGEIYRMFRYIDNSLAFDVIDSADQALLGGRAFGAFLRDLADLPPPPLFATIPRFHDASFRIEQFEQACRADRLDRCRIAAREIDYFRSQQEFLRDYAGDLAAHGVPLRVTHNDTKFNNVLFDASALTPLCVIDLDTVMPGYIAYDFGDAVRTGTAKSLEDDPVPPTPAFDVPLLKSFCEGFIGELAGALVESERRSLAGAPRYITLIMGMRFLTDFLDGDRYYATARDGHNLDRCRNQLALAESFRSASADIARVVADAFTAAPANRTGR